MKHSFKNVGDGYLMCRKCRLTFKGHFHDKAFDSKELTSFSEHMGECAPPDISKQKMRARP